MLLVAQGLVRCRKMAGCSCSWCRIMAGCLQLCLVGQLGPIAAAGHGVLCYLVVPCWAGAVDMYIGAGRGACMAVTKFTLILEPRPASLD